MPKEKTEVADNITADELSWIDDTEAEMEETGNKIASGEIPPNVVAGWDSDNWQTKAGQQPPDDIE